MTAATARSSLGNAFENSAAAMKKEKASHQL